MKITLDIPDTTMGAFFSYAYQGANAMFLGVKSIASGDMKDGALIKVQPEGENGDE